MIFRPPSTFGKRLGIDRTHLGVDLVRGGKLVAKDVGEREILNALDTAKEAAIVVSPIGQQGFVLGRGNLQVPDSCQRTSRPPATTSRSSENGGDADLGPRRAVLWRSRWPSRRSPHARVLDALCKGRSSGVPQWTLTRTLEREANQRAR